MNGKVFAILIVVATLPLGLWWGIPPAEREHQGISMSGWIEMTKSKNPADRIRGATALGQMGREEYADVKGTRLNFMYLHDKVTGGRCTSAMAPALVALLKDPEQSVRAGAVDALVTMGEYADAEMMQQVGQSNDPLLMWGIYAVYFKASKTGGRNIHQLFSSSEAGNKLMRYTENEPIPEYRDIIQGTPK